MWSGTAQLLTSTPTWVAQKVRWQICTLLFWLQKNATSLEHSMRQERQVIEIGFSREEVG